MIGVKWNVVLLLYVLSYRKDDTQFIMPNTVQECIDYLELPSVSKCMNVAELTPEESALYTQSTLFMREHVALFV